MLTTQRKAFFLGSVQIVVITLSKNRSDMPYFATIARSKLYNKDFSTYREVGIALNDISHTD